MKIGLQFIRFGLVGALNTAIHYAVFVFLFRTVGVQLLPASAIGYSLGLLNSFMINRGWTFQVTGGGRRRQFVRFVVVNLFAMGFNLLALHILVVILLIRPEISQVLAIGASLVVNFVGNRWWVFRVGTAAPGGDELN